MMIPDVFEKHSYVPRGIIHIGAHMCEERELYTSVGCGDDKVLWIEGIPGIVDHVKRTMPSTINIHSGVITDASGTVTFNISNNIQSSSYREFGTHAVHHPHVVYVERLELPAYTLPGFLDHVGESVEKYDTLAMDIQGAEYDVLIGAQSLLSNFRGIYLEVSTEDLYKGCGTLDDIDNLLAKHSFKRIDVNISQYQWGDAFYIKV